MASALLGLHSSGEDNKSSKPANIASFKIVISYVRDSGIENNNRKDPLLGQGVRKVFSVEVMLEPTVDGGQ